MASTIGRLPTPDEYLAQWKKIDANAADTYKYLNFDQARLDTHMPGVFERYRSTYLCRAGPRVHREGAFDRALRRNGRRGQAAARELMWRT